MARSPDQVKQTLFSQRVLTLLCDSLVTGIQESKKEQHRSYAYIAAMNSASIIQWLVPSFLWYHFIAFITLSFGSHSISYAHAQAQKNSPSSKQCEPSNSSHFQLLWMEKRHSGHSLLGWNLTLSISMRHNHLIGKCAISDDPQATKRAQFGKRITCFSLGVKVWQLSKYNMIMD